MDREPQSTTRVARPSRVSDGDDVVISALENDALILRLHFAINHLSRWLSPIHDQSRLDRAIHRGQPSARELVLRMRDEERRVFPLMHAIATRPHPDLDTVPAWQVTDGEREQDRRASAIQSMAEFRRLRLSTCSLLRSLPDTAWRRPGLSRREGGRTLRAFAEHLAEHDRERLTELDRALELSGARRGIAVVSQTAAGDLLSLAPTKTT